MNNLGKILICFLFIIAATIQSIGQDIGVVAKLSPSSGCQLGNNLTVTIQIFNFGSSFTSPFDVAYQVNGNAPVTETVNLGTFNASSSYSHTFATNVDLSVTGSYVMKFYTDLSGDVNNSNDTLTLTIVNDPQTVGGNLPSDFSVCELGNSGMLNLTSYTGSILDWETTTDGGTTWSSLSNTTDSESYLNISQTTGYRVVVKSGSCPQDYSTEVYLSVDPESIGGSVSGPSSICTPPNSASISLSGFQGVIVDWEVSTNGGSTWTGLGDNANPLNQANLSQTTLFRAEVQSGSCPSVYSDTLEIIVVSNLNGGDLTPVLDSVCITSGTGNLDLLNHIGIIDHWEYSTDLISWTTITNNTSSYSYSGLMDTTYFRVVVSGCTTDTSTIAQVNVNTNSDAGTIPASLDACEGDDINNISATGISGNQYLWESSVDGISWTTSGTQNTLNLPGVSSSQFLRFVVSNGACQADTSNLLTLNVSSLPGYTTVSFPDSLCISQNNDSIVYSGINTSILDWIYSEDAGITWNSLSQSDTVLNISPLVSTTYGVLVSSGACPADTFYTEVAVSQMSIPGIIPADTTICSSQDTLEVTNSAYTGNIVWYTSSDATGPFSVISTGGNSVSMSVSNDGYLFAEVINGVCPAAYTDTLAVNFFTANFGISGDTLVEQYGTATFEAYGGVSYFWETHPLISDQTSPLQSVEISESSTFMVIITDTNGCEYTDSLTINILDEGFQIATIMTPNSDGYNDAWVIKAPESYGEIKVTVTNPFGQIVYMNENYLSDWMGDFEGNSLPSGAYYYKVETADYGPFYGTLNILTNE